MVKWYYSRSEGKITGKKVVVKVVFCAIRKPQKGTIITIVIIYHDYSCHKIWQLQSTTSFITTFLPLFRKKW